jgi:hypothetical protein
MQSAMKVTKGMEERLVAFGACTIHTVPSRQELATQQRARILAAADLIREKQQAWNTYYQPPASCEHPVDWNAQVECGTCLAAHVIAMISRPSGSFRLP